MFPLLSVKVFWFIIVPLFLLVIRKRQGVLKPRGGLLSPLEVERTQRHASGRAFSLDGDGFGRLFPHSLESYKKLCAPTRMCVLLDDPPMRKR